VNTVFTCFNSVYIYHNHNLQHSQSHAPAALYPRNISGTLPVRGWGNPRTIALLEWLCYNNVFAGNVRFSWHLIAWLQLLSSINLEKEISFLWNIDICLPNYAALCCRTDVVWMWRNCMPQKLNFMPREVRICQFLHHVSRGCSTLSQQMSQHCNARANSSASCPNNCTSYFFAGVEGRSLSLSHTHAHAHAHARTLNFLNYP
jgi:hypothetical protein